MKVPTKYCKHFPSHLKCVATLPCKMQTLENDTNYNRNNSTLEVSHKFTKLLTSTHHLLKMSSFNLQSCTQAHRCVCYSLYLPGSSSSFTTTAPSCLQVNSALLPSRVAKSSTSFGWGKGGKVTAAEWQITLCDPLWYVISRSGVVITITNIYLYLYRVCDSVWFLQPAKPQFVSRDQTA